MKKKFVVPNSALYNDLLESVKNPNFNPFKLSSLVIPKLKGHEIEIVEQKIENAVLYGINTAEIKSYKYVLFLS